MKPHLPTSLYRSLLNLFALSSITLCPDVYAAAKHSDVSLMTYTDFGQNMGRYRTQEVNSLLQHLNSDGVRISYTGGQPDYTLLHGMISYESQGDNGAYAAVGYGYIATVQHNAAQNGSFTSRYIGSDSAIQYASIEYRNSDTFLLTPTADFKISRQSKIITDITPAAVYNNDALRENGGLVGQLLYRAGSGRQYLFDYSGNTTAQAPSYKYITGGISLITSNGLYTNKADEDSRGIADDSSTVSYRPQDWSPTGISDNYPMPDACLSGDSGSPMYIWDEASQSYQYLAAMQSAGGNLSVARTANQWVLDTIASFDKTVDFTEETAGDTVYINGVVTQAPTTVTDSTGQTANPWYGTITNANGETLVSFCGVKSGSETWAALNSEMDKEKWYAYSNSFLNTSQSDTTLSNLFMTENLVFAAGGENEETNIVLTDNVDLGVGYVEFRVEEGSSHRFHILSQEGESHILSSAGYVVGAGADVYLHLTNPADYAREWRKTGEGNLHIQGEGDNYVALNLGGSGVTYLERSNGYAAYNVLANNGTTVVLQEGDGIRQIARDFTFGNGGATLDFNGNSMVWNNDAAVEEDGFSIHALTEDAIIANNKIGSCSTITFTQAGQQEFKGSFTDTAESALRIVYQGGEGSGWHLGSIHTNLQHAQSGLTVQSGTVTLVGSNTVHAMGSIDLPNNAGRYSNEDDWHYADASMNVTVSAGGTFELGSHARLTGDITVEGGAFVMREGVSHQYEYIEGWYTKEDTDAIRDYFGLKGDVHLESGAVMKVEFSEGTTSHLTYEHIIDGEGNLSVDTGQNGGRLILSGANHLSGEKTLLGGTLMATDNTALGNVDTHRWVVGEKAGLASEGFTSDTSSATILSYIDPSSKGALLLTEDRAEQFNLTDHTNLIIGAIEGKSIQYGTAGTDECLAPTTDADGKGRWILGGGGGELVVNFRLSGANDLILGNEYQKGSVTLTNRNDFSGDIRFTGGVTLSTVGEEAIGNATIRLDYTNRFLSPNRTDNIAADSTGVMLVDLTPDQDVNLEGHRALSLASLHDATYSGELTLAEGQAYRFGGTEATFTVTSLVGGNHDLIIDGQTYSGGRVVLTRMQNLTGAVTIMGNKDAATYSTGDITLQVTQDRALDSASQVSICCNGHLDIAGTRQTLHQLDLGVGSSITDEVGGGTLSLSYETQGMISGSLRVENIEKVGAGELLLNGTDNSYSAFHFREGSATLMSNTGLSSTGEAVFHEGTTLTINGGVTAEANIQLDGGAVHISQATLGATGSITALEAGGVLSNATNAASTLAGSIGAVAGATLTVMGNTYNLSAQASNSDGGVIDFQASRLNLSQAVANQEQSIGGTLLINKAAGSTTILASSGAKDNLIRTLDRVELGAGNTLLIQEASWNTIWNIHELAGEGTLQWNSTTSHWYTSRLVLDGENSFTGDIILNRTAPTSRQGDRFYTGQIELAHNLAAQNAVVSLRGNNAYSIASLAINAENAHIVGLQGSTYSHLYAGAAVTDANGKTTTVDGTTTYNPPDSTRDATLTVTGDGTYTFSGSVSAGEDNGYGLSLVMDGSGSQTFNGSSVALKDVAVNRGELHLNAGQLSVTGNISLAGGALLDMGDDFTLEAGQTFSVSGAAGEDATPALFTGNLMLAGGDLSFGTLSAQADSPALSLGGVGFAEDLSMQTICFTSTSTLQTGVSYLLADGDWSSLGDERLTASFSSDYLTAHLTSGSDGLRVTFSVADGSFIWQGTEEAFSWDTSVYGPNDALSTSATAIFNDSAEKRTVRLTEAVSVEAMIFDNSQAAEYLVESGEEGALTVRHLQKGGDGTATIRANVTVEGDTDVNGGVLVMEQGRLTGDLNIRQAEVQLSGSATLEARTDGTVGNINIMEGGRLQVRGELHEPERLLLLQQGEIFLGGANNELQSITSTGGTLAGAEGSRLTTETLDFAAGDTLTVERVRVQINQENTLRTLNGGSVTTLAPTQGGVLDDRNSYYNLSGTLNIGSAEEGDAANGVVFINGICLSRENNQSFLNVAKGATLVVTGEKAITGTTDGNFGSFNLSHWGSALRGGGKYNQVNIGGTLTINSIISAWDNPASINLAEGGVFNLLKGISRNTNGRNYNITINAHDGARLNTAGGAHHDSLVVNLKAGSTLGMVGQDVSLSNNLHLGTQDAKGTVTIDTQATQVEEESLAVKALEEGGHLHLSGVVSSVGQTALNITGQGLLSLSGSLAVTDGLSVQHEAALSLSSDGTGGVSLSSSPRNGVEEARLTGSAALSLSDNTARISGEEENRTHLDNVLISLSEGSSLVLEHAVVEADSIIAGQVAAALAAADTNSAPLASVEFHDVTLQCRVGTNTEHNGEGTLAAGTQLFETGGSGESLTLGSDCSVLQLSSDMLSHIDFSGSQITLDFSGLDSLENFDFIAIQFHDSLLSNLSGTTLRATLDGEEQTPFVAYATSPEESTSTIYFATQMIPEPATTTLSLLALAALAARRRRK